MGVNSPRDACLAARERFPIAIEGCRELVVEMIRCALSDIAGNDEKARLRAWSFLRSPGAARLLAGCGVDPDYALERIERAAVEKAMGV